ncbi:hypothetical protein [Aquitalea magnusonii]|uniref:hypothetical protein n=1 Tax=Aquitalea magnusonii TaxID=332411 RepID=UPI000D774EEA|nr:hypothetical protein [Aquitalea magnusonii]
MFIQLIMASITVPLLLLIYHHHATKVALALSVVFIKRAMAGAAMPAILFLMQQYGEELAGRKA